MPSGRMRGAKLSKKHKENIGKALKGRVVPAETRQRMRVAALKRWAASRDVRDSGNPAEVWPTERDPYYSPSYE